MKTLSLILLLAPSAIGQLVPVDQGVADRGPLSISHRMVPLDLRAPTAFDRVYEGWDRNGKRVFLRIDGAVIASFSSSVYEPTEQGQIALIPPGTTFHIGEPSMFEIDSPTLIRRSPTAIDRRITAPDRASPTASLWTDEAYRHARVRLRLRQASAAK